MITENFSEQSELLGEIDITPDISLMPKLGFAGYSAPQAIGELVDNAIDARLENTLLNVSIKIGKDFISIADNGKGMEKEIISKALVLAFSTKKGQLGEFGLGMKTACLSLGDQFEIMTKSQDDKYEYLINFDKKEWESSSRGWKVPLKQRPGNVEDHFTIIKIQQLKVFYPNLHNYIREDLQRRYAPFIRTGQLQVKVNDRSCKQEEFDLVQETRKEFSLSVKGHKISGWYALLREGSQKGLYGFHTFRRGRMITTYDKVGFDPHPTLARIMGEIHMDHIPVTHNKREFIKESSEYRDAETALREELKEIVKMARRKATQDTVTEDIKRSVDLWKDKLAESLRSDEFKNYTSRIKGVDVVSDPSGEETGDVQVEKREDSPSPIVNEPKAKDERNRNPKDTIPKNRHVIRIKGKNFFFDHAFSPLGYNQPWKTYTFNKEKGTLEIFTNTDFPAYLATTDRVFYAVIHISEALAEVFIQAAQEDATNIEDLRDLILRKASELKAQL